MSQFIINPYNYAAAAPASGGWVELGRTTAGGTTDSLDVTSLADKRYYMILSSKLSSGNADIRFRFNGDTGTNYARRQNFDGGTDGTATSQNVITSGNGAEISTPAFLVGYIANLSSKEKLMQTWKCKQDTAGAGTSPHRTEVVSKWANTSAAINQITMLNAESGDYASGTEFVVLGWDPADTHTNNFWEELASVDLSGGAADSLTTSTITAKKYLWIQRFAENSGAIQARFRFNSDSGTNYARRLSANGAADGTVTSQTGMQFPFVGSVPAFYNLFVINNSSNEKLVIGHQVQQNTAGAGNAPNRAEAVYKWANTSSQITEVSVHNDGAGDFGTKTTIKVWGAD